MPFADGKNMSMKSSYDTIGNRTRDVPAYSAVPKPTAPPRASYNINNVCNNGHFSTPYLFLDTREQYCQWSEVINYYTLDADASTSYSKFRIHRPVFLPLNFIPERSVSISACRYDAAKYYTSFSGICKTGQNCGEAETEWTSWADAITRVIGR